VNNIVATEEIAGAGALTYWTLSGELDPAALAEGWEDAGLEESKLPSPPSSTVALSRAVREQQSRHRLVRKTRDGYAIVNEKVAGNDLDYGVELHVSLDAAGRVTGTPAEHIAIEQVRSDYDHHLGVCTAEDIGAWLCRLVREHDGVALRDTGGFYYVPPTRLEAWKQATRLLGAVSTHKVYLVPAMRSEDAVEAILAAVQGEAEAEAAQVEKELEGASLGERALSTRESRLHEVEAKVGRYEALLGVTLERFRERLKVLQAGVSAAMLRAMAEDAAE
jgi:hypothetical protein